MAILLRYVQRFAASRRQEFMDLEKQFAGLEQRGILSPGERMSPISSRDSGNTLVWQGRFESIGAAGEFLKFAESHPEHIKLFDRQKLLFEDSWVEFYEILDF
jgi:hypothetical protein